MTRRWCSVSVTETFQERLRAALRSPMSSNRIARNFGIQLKTVRTKRAKMYASGEWAGNGSAPGNADRK